MVVFCVCVGSCTLVFMPRGWLSRCVTWLQNQFVLTACQLRDLSHMWDHRSYAQRQRQYAPTLSADCKALRFASGWLVFFTEACLGLNTEVTEKLPQTAVGSL